MPNTYIRVSPQTLYDYIEYFDDYHTEEMSIEFENICPGCAVNIKCDNNICSECADKGYTLGSCGFAYDSDCNQVGLVDDWNFDLDLFLSKALAFLNAELRAANTPFAPNRMLARF